MNTVKNNTDSQNVDLAISVMFNEFGIQTLTAQDVLPPSGPDMLAIMSTILELQKCYQVRLVLCVLQLLVCVLSTS